MAKARLTETLLRQIAVEWLGGKSWRKLGNDYHVHPKYLCSQAKRLGYLEPHNVRKCPTCFTPKELPAFTRIGAGHKPAVMHECNDCLARERERCETPALKQPLIESERERWRLESIEASQAYLAKVRARLRALAATQRLSDPPPTT